MVYVFLAEGFEEMEALAPVDILRRAGVQVQIVGVGSQTVSSSHGVCVNTDITTQNIQLDDKLEMIVLPGGMPGTLNLEANPDVLAAIDYCADNDKFIAAICAAPQILGHKGLLEGKYATCFPGFEKELKGAVVTGKSVSVDGKIITSKGAGCSIKFGLKLVEQLCSTQKAEGLEASLQCSK